MKLFEAAKGTYLEIPVLLGAFYGFRRSEIVGLRRKMIDFDEDTITINHTITVSTTANIYSHLDYNSKILSANAMMEAVNINI